jgi:hypothetical protein
MDKSTEHNTTYQAGQNIFYLQQVGDKKILYLASSGLWNAEIGEPMGYYL